MISLSKRINQLFAQEQWAKARALIQGELKKDPANHWLLTRLGTTHYEQGDYQEAYKFAKQAQTLASNCPLVLWDMAGALDMLGREKEAILMYRKLFFRGAQGLANDECGEGITWANALLTDCLYRLGGCYRHLGQSEQALWCYRKYVDLRSLGIRSIYRLGDARKPIIELTKDPSFVDKELSSVKRKLLAV